MTDRRVDALEVEPGAGPVAPRTIRFEALSVPTFRRYSTADHVFGLGAAGGKAGGEVVAEGTPEVVARVRWSFTDATCRDLLATGEVRGIA